MPTSDQADSVTEFLRLCLKWWDSIWARRAAVNELARYDAVDVAHIAHDLGISTADLHALARRDKTAADLLYGRLDALRIDPKKVDRGTIQDPSALLLQLH